MPSPNGHTCPPSWLCSICSHRNIAPSRRCSVCEAPMPPQCSLITPSRVNNIPWDADYRGPATNTHPTGWPSGTAGSSTNYVRPDSPEHTRPVPGHPESQRRAQSWYTTTTERLGGPSTLDHGRAYYDTTPIPPPGSQPLDPRFQLPPDIHIQRRRTAYRVPHPQDTTDALPDGDNPRHAIGFDNLPSRSHLGPSMIGPLYEIDRNEPSGAAPTRYLNPRLPEPSNPNFALRPITRAARTGRLPNVFDRARSVFRRGDDNSAGEAERRRSGWGSSAPSASRFDTVVYNDATPSSTNPAFVHRSATTAGSSTAAGFSTTAPGPSATPPGSNAPTPGPPASATRPHNGATIAQPGRVDGPTENSSRTATAPSAPIPIPPRTQDTLAPPSAPLGSRYGDPSRQPLLATESDEEDADEEEAYDTEEYEVEEYQVGDIRVERFRVERFRVEQYAAQEHDAEQYDAEGHDAEEHDLNDASSDDSNGSDSGHHPLTPREVIALSGILEGVGRTARRFINEQVEGVVAYTFEQMERNGWQRTDRRTFTAQLALNLVGVLQPLLVHRLRSVIDTVPMEDWLEAHDAELWDNGNGNEVGVENEDESEDVSPPSSTVSEPSLGVRTPTPSPDPPRHVRNLPRRALVATLAGPGTRTGGPTTTTAAGSTHPPARATNATTGPTTTMPHSLRVARSASHITFGSTGPTRSAGTAGAPSMAQDDTAIYSTSRTRPTATTSDPSRVGSSSRTRNTGPTTTPSTAAGPSANPIYSSSGTRATATTNDPSRVGSSSRAPSAAPTVRTATSSTDALPAQAPTAIYSASGSSLAPARTTTPPPNPEVADPNSPDTPALNATISTMRRLIAADTNANNPPANAPPANAPAPSSPSSSTILRNNLPDLTCKVCMEAVAEWMPNTCRHISMCRQCKDSLTTKAIDDNKPLLCPICRAEVGHFVQVRFP